jgi:hypothetical protein
MVAGQTPQTAGIQKVPVGESNFLLISVATKKMPKNSLRDLMKTSRKIGKTVMSARHHSNLLRAAALPGRGPLHLIIRRGQRQRKSVMFLRH